jgi:putative membrane protein
MAANQGIYNSFLAVGLIRALLIRDVKWQWNVDVCFLSFVATAGVVAALTVAVKAGLSQILPAGTALDLLFLSRDKPAA